MKKTTAVFIDAGHLKVIANQYKQNIYNADYVEKIVFSSLLEKEEELFRAFYYDCPPYIGTHNLPVSGLPKEFRAKNIILDSIAKKDYFAMRLGVLKFKGFSPKVYTKDLKTLTDSDFKPNFEQKGVDMRIGLDIAHIANTRTAQRIILITNDTDFIPALKYARRAGLQVVLLGFPKILPAKELLPHVDFYRKIDWPK